MATVITRECINCGACESECPNTAIYQGGVEWVLNDAKHAPLATDIFYIVPEKCTECVGFFDQEACAAVCPVDCCVPDPEIPESEEQLLARARQLHPERTFPADFPSRFRKAGAVAPVAPPAAAGPPVAVAPEPPPAASPSPPPAPPPAVVPAPPLPVAGPARETRPGAESTEQAAHVAPKAEKRFAGELDEDFDLLLERLQQPTGDASRARFGALAALVMPLWRRVMRKGDTGRFAGSRTRIPVSGTIPFDGFYACEFDEKRDRLRRYGEVYAVTDLGRGYLVRVEFPERVPPSSTKEQLQIADEMPDYDYDLHLSDGSLVVRGRLADPRLRKLASGAPSLPPDFTVRIELAASARGFKHRYRDKVLEVAVAK